MPYIQVSVKEEQIEAAREALVVGPTAARTILRAFALIGIERALAMQAADAPRIAKADNRLMELLHNVDPKTGGV